MGPLQLEVMAVLWQISEQHPGGFTPEDQTVLWETDKRSVLEIWKTFNENRTAAGRPVLAYSTIWQILRRLQKQHLLIGFPKYCKGKSRDRQQEVEAPKIPAYVHISHDDLEKPPPPPPVAPLPVDPAAEAVEPQIRTWCFVPSISRREYLQRRVNELWPELAALMAGADDQLKTLIQVLCIREGSAWAKKLQGYLETPLFRRGNQHANPSH